MKDATIYTLFNDKMVKLEEPRNPASSNFLITCSHGDWSGFRTLKGCEDQFPELEDKKKPNFYYNVVER